MSIKKRFVILEIKFSLPWVKFTVSSTKFYKKGPVSFFAVQWFYPENILIVLTWT